MKRLRKKRLIPKQRMQKSRYYLVEKKKIEKKRLFPKQRPLRPVIIVCAISDPEMS